ncbi:MAG: hypothetical protein NW226_22085, partial [Microscillaceae bacterium]|nr:hypothetical protein [Microscillaceae bacterium]
MASWAVKVSQFLSELESGHFQEYLAQAPLRSCLRQVSFFYLVPILAPDGGTVYSKENILVFSHSP